MKRLTLLRHAKSDWHTGQKDYDRPLNARGERDAPEMGRRYAERLGSPDAIVASTANRAWTTANHFARELDYPYSDLIAEGELYHASPGTLLHVTNQLADDLSHVVLVAHNPGLTEFATLMSDRRLDNLPTAGIWSMLFDESSWSGLVPGAGTLDWYDYPKSAS